MKLRERSNYAKKSNNYFPDIKLFNIVNRSRSGSEFVLIYQDEMKNPTGV